MPLWITRHFSRRILKKDTYLSFYFHPWELSDINAYSLPAYIKRVSGKRMQQKMDGFLSFLQQQGIFCTHTDLLKDRSLVDYRR